MSKAIMPPTDGEFYAANRGVQHLCERCGKTHRRRPTVAAYNVKFDHGGIQAMKHPGWPQTGWLALWRCYDGAYRYEVVSAVQVAEWGRDLGGWHYE